MTSKSLIALFEEEDLACDFLQLGSGWKAPSEDSVESIAMKLFSACLDADQLAWAQSWPQTLSGRDKLSSRFECKAPRACGHLLNRQGSDRVAPYTRDTKSVSRCQESRQGGKSVAILECDRNPPLAPSYNQADFENLCLGPGCPFSEAVDLHI